MSPLLAIGPPGEPFSGVLLGIAQAIALLPATHLLAWMLLPTRLTATPRFTSHLEPIWRAARLALGCALAGGLCVIGSLFARGFGSDPAGFFGWFTPSLYVIAGFAALFILCRKLAHRPAPGARPGRPLVCVSLLLLASILIALWWHDQPHLHLLLLKKASLPFILGTLYATWLAGPPASRLTAITRVLLPGLVVLPLSWHTARATASWQDQRASAYADKVLSLIHSHLAQHGRVPGHLPPEALAAAPPGWRGQLAYLSLGREFTLIYPLTFRPGAEMHFDSNYPKWVWYGASDFGTP